MKEFEKRGPLGSEQLTKLADFLKGNATLIKEESEKVVFFDTKKFPAIGDFKNGSARISLKCDNKGNFIRIKEGNPSNEMRSEYSVELRRNDIENLVYILSRLGLTNGFYRPTERTDFKYKNLIITIKTNCVMGDHFEIELIDSTAHFEDEIKELLNNVPLTFWTTEEYKSKVSDLMITNPAINILGAKIF